MGSFGRARKVLSALIQILEIENGARGLMDNCSEIVYSGMDNGTASLLLIKSCQMYKTYHPESPLSSWQQYWVYLIGFDETAREGMENKVIAAIHDVTVPDSRTMSAWSEPWGYSVSKGHIRGWLFVIRDSSSHSLKTMFIN